MKVVCLLRGINVGGHKKIKMVDLRALLLELGLRDVVTYIQSGNIVFDPSGKSESELISTIEAGIDEAFGFEVPAVIRSHEELARIIRDSPFGPVDLATEGTHYGVSFLESPPTEDRAALLETLVVLPERLVVREREVYLHCPNGFGQSKLPSNAIESKLRVRATARNWKSLIKLYELSAPES